MKEAKLPLTYRVSMFFGFASSTLVAAPILIGAPRSAILLSLWWSCGIASILCAVVDVLLVGHLAINGAKTPKTPLLLCIPIVLVVVLLAVWFLLLPFLLSKMSFSLPGH